MHAFFVQIAVHMGHPVVQNCRAHFVVIDDVTITPASSRKPRMKVITDLSTPLHGNGIWQICINTHGPGFEWTRYITVEMHHLTGCVNACIGSSGALHLNSGVGDCRQRFF